MSFPRHAQASRLFLPIFNKEAVICNYSAIIISPADSADSADISDMQIKEVANHGNAADMRYAYFVADCADCLSYACIRC